MKKTKLVDLIKQKNIVVPLYLLPIYPKLKLSLEEFIFLMYLKDQGETFVFNPNQIAEEYHLQLPQVLNYISTLTEKHLLRVEVIKNDKNVMEEYVNLEDFYQRISLFLTEYLNDVPKEIDSNVFEMVEKEFGRTLSPMEYEIIKAWLENDTSEELIKEALKEATYNGVSNLRYIDKILYEWGKKGIKTKDDVIKHQTKYRQEKKEMKEVFDYDWFEDDDEELNSTN